jgi:transglutaminase-like putative cysteine protease
MANAIAYRAAREPWLKGVAYEAAGPVWRSLPRRGPRAIASWVRRQIRYARECPGVEVLQGPRATLEVGVGDCDDMAILWSALCLSLGLPAEVGGVGRWGHNPIHAIGVDPANSELLELSKDWRYTGLFRPLHFDLPRGYYCLSWDAGVDRLRLLPVGSRAELAGLEESCRIQTGRLAGLWG